MQQAIGPLPAAGGASIGVMVSAGVKASGGHDYALADVEPHYDESWANIHACAPAPAPAPARVPESVAVAVMPVPSLASAMTQTASNNNWQHLPAYPLLPRLQDAMLQPTHLPVELLPEEAEEAAFQNAWLAFLWARAASLGVERQVGWGNDWPLLLCCSWDQSGKPYPSTGIAPILSLNMC